MNEQIRELAKQAGIFYYRKGKLQVDMEKFTEVIVCKCANIVWDEAEKTNNKDVNDAGYKILEYFGVE